MHSKLETLATVTPDISSTTEVANPAILPAKAVSATPLTPVNLAESAVSTIQTLTPTEPVRALMDTTWT